jgi:hypothetical protein
MKQQNSRRTAGRWSKRSALARSAPAKLALHSSDDSPPVREPRTFDRIVGQRPYESSYDISRGYMQDRSIVLP